MNMYQYTRNLELLYETPAELPIDVAPPKQNLKAMLRRAERTGIAMLTEAESKRFISTYGFPVAEQRTVGSVEEALVAADELGYPTALKVVAYQITHKSEVGGVELGVCSPADLRAAYDACSRTWRRAHRARPSRVSRSSGWYARSTTS